MQQFTVPQFIDVENKIIGPITTTQFVIMLAGALIIGASYKIFDFSLFIAVAVVVLALVAVIGFIRINGRPFYYFMLNLIQTFKRAKLRVWNNSLIGAIVEHEEVEIKAIEEKIPPKRRYTSSRLTELSLIVDTGGAYKGEDVGGKIKIEKI